MKRPSLAIDGYTFERELERNPGRTLYSGLDARISRRVMIGIFDATKATIADEYHSRMRALAQMEHPNLARVLDVGLHNNNVYVISESVDGPDLKSLMGSGTFFPFELKIEAIIGTSDGLHCGHSAGFVHRDVRPQTIRMDAAGTVKLQPFSFSIADHPELHRLVRPSHYSSPEQVHGINSVDPRSDLFSLATILYEWIAGVRPFGGDDAATAMARIISEPYTPLRNFFPGCAEELEKTIEQALSKRPADRFATCAEFSEKLRAFVSALPAMAVELRRKTDVLESEVAGAKATVARLGIPDQTTDSAGPAQLAPDSIAPEEKDDYGITLIQHARLSDELHSVGKTLERALPVVKALSEAHRHFQMNDFEACNRALQQLSKLAPNLSDAERLRELSRRSKLSDLRKREYQKRGDSLLKQARGAMDREQAALTLLAVNALLAVDPQNPEVIALRDEAVKRLANEGSDRRERMKNLLETARARLRSGEFDAALKASEELMRLKGGIRRRNKDPEGQ